MQNATRYTWNLPVRKLSKETYMLGREARQVQ